MPAVLRLPTALLALLLSALGVGRMAPSAADGSEAPVVLAAAADAGVAPDAVAVVPAVACSAAPDAVDGAPRCIVATVAAPAPSAAGLRLGSARGPRAP